MTIGRRAAMALLLAFILAIAVPVSASATSAEGETSVRKLIYDEAGLLDEQQYDVLNRMANRYSAKRETDIIIYTTNNPGNVDVVKLTQDFYDERGPGYDKPHGNAVILTLDMKNRDLYLAGFYKGMEYLDDGRLDKIRVKITPELEDNSYYFAFDKYIKTAHRYMGVRPGANPDNILFNGWFQFGVAVLIAGLIVGRMAAHSGGRVTVNRQTYEDTGTSGILQHRDQYLRTTVSKTKIERSSGGGGGGFGGGGGGRTGGGHSHSGSRGKF